MSKSLSNPSQQPVEQTETRKFTLQRNSSVLDVVLFEEIFSQISIRYTLLQIAPQNFVNSKKRNNKQCLFKCTQYRKYLQCFGKQLISVLLEELLVVYFLHPRKVPNTQTFMEGNDSIFVLYRVNLNQQWFIGFLTFSLKKNH